MVDRILVPIDSSESAERALRFGAELARQYHASIEVVHFTDVETEATNDLIDHARAILEEEDIEADPAIEHDLRLTFKSSDRIGQNILDLVEEEGYDHVVMGHHGAGTVERIVLGSATETVVRANEVAVTVVP